MSDGRAHAILGASSSERWMNCAASIRLSKGMPNKSSIYAMEGTAAHHLSELCMRMEVPPQHFVGQFISYQGEILDEMPDFPDFENNPVFEIRDDGPDEMAPAVSVYLNYLDAQREHLRLQYKEEPILLIEKQFDLSSVYPGMFGTNDAGLYIPGIYLEAADYKHGKGKAVEIDGNSQLRYYGLGALIELCQDELDEPEKLVTTVIQPRKKHINGPVRQATYDTPDIRVGFANELVAAAKRTEDPNSEIKPGEWCFFCPAKAVCPATTTKLQALTSVDMFDLSEEEMGMPAAVVQKLVERSTRDPETLSKVLEFLPMLDSFSKEVRAFAVEQAKGGAVVPAFKLAPKKTHRKVTDEVGLKKELLQVGVKPEELMTTPKLRSPAQLEKVRPEGVAPARIKEIVGKYSEKPEGELELVPADDIREAVVITADAFGDLGENDLILDVPFIAVDDDFNIL